MRKIVEARDVVTPSSPRRTSSSGGRRGGGRGGGGRACHGDGGRERLRGSETPTMLGVVGDGKQKEEKQRGEKKIFPPSATLTEIKTRPSLCPLAFCLSFFLGAERERERERQRTEKDSVPSAVFPAAEAVCCIPCSRFFPLHLFFLCLFFQESQERTGEWRESPKKRGNLDFSASKST